ncbi:hypothetical protein WKH57_01075 [Niallia taxi]|uniref:hypothetical protein n=1 Tax=Niallia taxi TaxID=2499688 RepID=UPI0031738966
MKVEMNNLLNKVNLYLSGEFNQHVKVGRISINELTLYVNTMKLNEDIVKYLHTLINGLETNFQELKHSNTEPGDMVEINFKINKVKNETTEVHSPLKNYYGSVHAVKDSYGYWMCLEDHDDINYIQISEEFYSAFKKEFGESKM